MKAGVIPEDWKAVCIISIYKGKGNIREYANYRGISILNMPGKIYGRILISRVMENTKQVVEEQGVFRSGRGYIDQIFVSKQLVQKYREKRKELYVAHGPGEGMFVEKNLMGTA